MHNKGNKMANFTLDLTDEEMDIVYDALEEIRLIGHWTSENAELVAEGVQDKISAAFRKINQYPKG